MARKRYKKQKPLLDIVIPTYGRFDLLNQCLDAIPEAVGDIQYQIIIVTNHFLDQEEEDEFCQSLSDDVILIRNIGNLGFARACNQGARKGRSPLILLLNTDVILEPMSLDLMVRDLDDKEIGIVGAHLVFPEYAGGLNQNIRPANKTQHIGLETDIHGNWKHIFIGWSSDHPKVMARRETYGVTGAALMTRRRIWDQVGGFDEAYGAGTWEDMDFCMSVRKLGYNIVVNPQAKGIHFTGASAEEYRIPFPLHENKMLFMQRWQNELTWTEGLAY